MKLKLLGAVAGVWLAAVVGLPTPTALAAAGACSPTTDYGSVTQSVTIPATGTYTIWSRLATDSSADSSYMLQIDSSYCFTVGNSAAKSIPIYASGTTTHFNNDSSNWLKTDTAGGTVQVASLGSGPHTIKLIGNAPNVLIDRVIFTQDATCIPTGFGDNCAAPPDTTPPTVSISTPADNATVSTVTSATANATDDVGVTKVEFYVDNALKATDVSAPYSYSIDPTALSLGTHQLTVKAYDAAGNNSMSAITHFTVADATKPTVSLTTPTAGSTQSGTIILTAAASDNVGVTKVDFFADGGATAVATDTTATAGIFSASYDTTKLSNGSHTITAKAYDAAGNTNSTTASYTVSNQPISGDITPPTISLSPITTGLLLNNNSTDKPYNSSSYPIAASVADASGIKSVVFKIDGATQATLTTAPYNFNANLTSLGCGAHTLSVVATDNAVALNTATTSVAFTITKAQDINGLAGCAVDYLDLSVLASNYGKTGSAAGRADINGDGVVDYLDLSSLASSYGK